jgi:hypothetical protein
MKLPSISNATVQFLRGCEKRKLLLQPKSCVDADKNYDSRNIDNISSYIWASTSLISYLYTNKTEKNLVPPLSKT